MYLVLSYIVISKMSSFAPFGLDCFCNSVAIITALNSVMLVIHGIKYMFAHLQYLSIRLHCMRSKMVVVDSARLKDVCLSSLHFTHSYVP